jgi:hypothetical protein
MNGQGHLAFTEALARFAAGAGDERVTAIAERAAAPLRVVVRGRRGVGRRTVAAALSRAGTASGLVVTTHPEVADEDIVVYVFTEVLKPEDIEAIGAARSPLLAVLNKADLAGSLSGRGGDGPIAAAHARCAQLSALAGVTMEPMIGLLADAALDVLDQDVWADVWAGMRLLAASDSVQALFECSCDGFLSPDNPDNPVPIGLRRRLLDSLDLFGTALAVAAVRRGATAPQVRALLRRVSGVDAVVDKVGAVGAEARYRRVLDAVAELEALAVTEEGIEEQIGGFLSRDDTVVARMAAAVDLAEASGLDLGLNEAALTDRDGPAAHLARAARWQRYFVQSRGKSGPASDLHRACAADIARGSLRQWSQTRGEAR